MADHTVGRVHVMPHTDPSRMVAVATDAKGDVVAFCGIKGLPNEANARRIAALWNACGGISTATLEKIAGYEEFDHRHELLSLELHKDALVAALPTPEGTVS